MKRIICGVLSLALMCSAFVGCADGDVVQSADISSIVQPETTAYDAKSEYVTAAETDSLILDYSPGTAKFKVTNKKDGSVYFSSPETSTLNAENALFEVNYADSRNNLMTFNTYSDSILKGQFVITPVKDGIKMDFSMGDLQQKMFCPPAVTKERFEGFVKKIEGAFDRQKFSAHYGLIDIAKIAEDKKSGVLAKYPTLADGPLYVISGDRQPLSVQKEIDRILVGIGYTQEEYEIDLLNMSSTSAEGEPAFQLSFYVTLEGDQLLARMPVSEIVEINKGKVLSIVFLRNFGTPKFGEKGSFLLPDGSGTQMNFYNGKGDLQEYAATVYGLDRVIPQNELVNRKDQAYLPIFAKQYEKRAMLATIQDGDSLAEIRATPGTDTAYAAAYPVFSMRATTTAFLNDSKRTDGFKMYQKHLYDGSFAVSYRFLAGEQSTKRAIADQYAKTLFSTDEVKSPSIYLEFFGAAKEIKSVVGVSVNTMTTFSTLREIKQIVEDLTSNGVKNLVLKLTGFFSNGLEQPYAEKLKLNTDTGSKKDLQELTDYCKANNIELYFDVDVQYVRDTMMFDGYSVGTDIAYQLDKAKGHILPFNAPTYLALGSNAGVRDMLTPKAVDKAITASGKLAEKLGLSGLSLKEVGTDVNSDNNEKRPVERQKASSNLKASLSNLTEKTPIITTGANAVVLPYVDHVLSVPMWTAYADSADATVPLLQMVLSDKVGYTDRSINLTGMSKRFALDSLSGGAGFAYTLVSGDNANMQKTNAFNSYSMLYSYWRQDILDKSQMLNDTADVTKGGVAERVELAKGITKTTYAKGGYIICNNTDESYTHQGKSIAGYSYVTGKE